MREDVARSFSGLSRLAQAVLGYATLACIQQPSGEAPLADIIRGLALTDDEWESAHTELYDARALWLTGDDLDCLDRIQTAPTYPLCIASHAAPTNRPKAKDWDLLRARVFKSMFDDVGLTPHCLYCKAEGVPLELDHILPLSRGGSNHFLNLVPACKPCNSAKGGKTYQEWRGL